MVRAPRETGLGREIAPQPEPIPEQEAAQEARFSGLPTHEEVNHELRLIDRSVRLELADKKTSYVPKLPIDIPASKTPREISPENYQEFRTEFTEDLGAFSLRIERLKVRALTSLLAGSYPYQPGRSFDEEDKTPIGSLRKRIVKYEQGREEITETVRQELIRETNRSIPSEYALRPLPQFSQYDARDLYELTMSLTYGKPPTPESRKLLGALLAEIAALEKQITGIEEQGELFTKDATTFINEERFRDLWERYRDLLKQIAVVEELGSWYSPTWAAAIKGQRGEKQESRPFFTDYQRFMMPEAQRLERELNAHYFREGQESYAKIESLLFNGGLNALTAILEVVDREFPYWNAWKLPGKPMIFKTRDIYFEVDHLLDDHYRKRGVEPETFDPMDTEVLIKRVKKDLPTAVFLNPLSNMYRMEVTEVTRLLEALTDDEWSRAARKQFLKERKGKDLIDRKMYIVIDNSTLGRLAKWRKFNFYRLPSFVKVIAFESLIKYAEDGQELAQAGLVTAIGEYVSKDIESVRSQMGFMPPESTVRRLAAIVPPDITDRNMARHSRNALLIARELEAAAREPDSFIAGVTYPGLPSHPQHAAARGEMTGAGGLLTVRLNLDVLKGYQERLKNIYGAPYLEQPLQPNLSTKTARGVATAFNNLVIILAREVGLDQSRNELRLSHDPHGSLRTLLQRERGAGS